MSRKLDVIRKLGNMDKDVFLSAIQNVVVRYWIKGDNDGAEAYYGKITNFIDINGKTYVAICPEDTTVDVMYIEKFDDVSIQIVEYDQEEGE